MNSKRKHIVIAGGSRGVGRATAERLAEAGAHLILVARQRRPLEETVKALPGVHQSVAGDVTEPDTWDRVAAAVAAWPAVDGLFFNAGFAPFAGLDDIELELFDRCLRTHVWGVLLGIRRLREQLAAPCSVLLTGSGMHHRPLPESTLWAASTHAVRGLARSLAVELAPRGVRVNLLSHGPVDTPIFEDYGMPSEQVQGMKRQLAEGTLLRRLALPREIAEIAALLLDDGYATGSEVLADGGWTLRGAGS